MALKSGRVGIHPSQVDPITGMLLSSPGGTTDYTPLTNKPQINGVTLLGNKSLSDLGIATSLANLQDVTITDPQDGAYLTYDSASSKWVNTTTPPAPVVPEGSTVTPTDDIQTWLACAGITDKTYTTLNEVLADSTTLLALMSDNNAVDYLVRSTTWASEITANSTAMTDIGANNYCAETLLADSTWCAAICNSTYFENVLNVKVPTMTSNTTPSGVASASSEYTSISSYAWKAFDGVVNVQDGWYTNSSPNQWIQYQFTSAVKVYKMVHTSWWYDGNASQSLVKDWKLQGSNDGSSFTDIISGTDSSTGTLDIPTLITPTTSYQYYRFIVLDTYISGTGLRELQFYGR